MTLLIADCCHIRGIVDESLQKKEPDFYRVGAVCYCGKGTLREMTPAERALLSLNDELHQMVKSQAKMIHEADLLRLAI